MNNIQGRGSSGAYTLVIAALCCAASTLHSRSVVICAGDEETRDVILCDRTGIGGASSTGRSIGQPKPPNVLLIGIETLRADHVSCLGYGKDTTPTLDRLAREGFVCTRTMSTSGWTLPSVMSVMTSLYPDVHQVYTYERRLSDEITTLADILKESDYTTIGFISNPVLHGTHGFSNGFDLYDDFTIAMDSGLDVFGNHDRIFSDQHSVCTSDLLTRTVATWLRHRSDDPFFMFVFYMDPHYDYIPPAPFDTMFDPDYEGHMDGCGIVKEPRRSQRPSDRDLQHLLALYDGEIRYTDAYVDRLLQAFAQEGLLDNTLVVVFGDHGDEFYEHGKTAHDRTLYDEIVHVPLIFWWPDRIAGGKRIQTITSLVDIMPTTLDYLDLSWPGPMQGVSLRPWIEGRPGESRETVWAELNTWTHVQAVIANDSKLIRNVGRDTWELYHLLSDPTEQANLYGNPSATETRLVMVSEYEQWIKRNHTLMKSLLRGSGVDTVPLDEQRLLRLKALGYVQ